MTLPKYLLLFITALFVLFPAGAQEIPASEAGSPDESDGTDTPVIALVLQGGGALGIAHIAVIDEIERLGIPIDMVVGTSMGAIVGGLYSAGYTPAELEALIGDTDWMQLFIPDPPYYKKSIHQRYDESRYISFSFSRTGESTARGLISDRNILAYMDRLTLDFPDNMDFDTLPRKFRAVALDINTSEKVVIGEGSLTDAMRASMGIPGFFAPYELDGSILVDGGVVDNLPIEVARDLGADYIIAVQLSGGMDYTPEELKSSPLSSVARAIDLLLYQNVKHQLDMADFVLDIDLTGYQPADFGKGDEILERGRIAVEESADGFLKVRDEVLVFGTSSELREYPVPPVAGVRIEGASARDLKRIEPLLKPFEGNYPDEEIIETLVNELTSSGHYETVRISRELTREGESDLVLSLKKNNRTNSFNVGVLSGSTYSGNVMSREVFSGAVILRDLLIPDSKWTFGFQMSDAPGLSFGYLQYRKPFYLNLSYSLSTDITLFPSGDSGSFQLRTNRGELALGVNPANIFNIFAGAVFDASTPRDAYDEIPAGILETPLALLHTRFEVLTLDSFIFPERGVHSSTGLYSHFGGTSGRDGFYVLDTFGTLALPVSGSLSFELEWQLGTDFSIEGDSSRSAPALYKPVLSNRRMFPGVLDYSDQYGSYVGGISMLWKYNFSARSGEILFPVYALAQGAVGFAFQDSAQFRSPMDSLSWHAALGGGVRLTDAFGVMMRIGPWAGSDHRVKPYIAIDIGSFGIRN